MTKVNPYNISQTYKNEYLTWRDYKDLRAAKRQEYLRRNPDTIKDYDLQRTKILLSAVDMMDKSITQKSDSISVAFETATSLGLGYAALGGASLGYLFSKLGFVKKNIDKFTQKIPKSKNFVSVGITAICGILGVIASYPIYNILSGFQSKIYRKRRFETMEKELENPKIFVVLDDEQKKIFNENIEEIQKNKTKQKYKSITKKEIKNLKEIVAETINFDKKQAQFKNKYTENKSLYEKPLTDKEIKNAKKDMVLLNILIKEINTNAQSYEEKMQKITDNLITGSFALGSLFTLCYERIVKKLNFKTSSIPAGLGILLLATSTFFATWAQKRAAHVGRYKAKQDLIKNPEQLIYISSKKTDSIEDSEIEIEPKQKTNTFKFLKEFFKNNKEYISWKKTESLTGNDIINAMENIEISPEQIKDGKRLQRNLFKTFYKIDKNTQNYSNNVTVASESIKYPTTLILGTIGSVWGMKHLSTLRITAKPSEVFKSTCKYIGIISLFTIPTLFINSYFAKAKKMAARISDMITMKGLEDYRFFADYSRFEENTNM